MGPPASPGGRSRSTGSWGERVAASHLKRYGWNVLARNYREGRHEIDLVVRRAEMVAFVEVKTRSGKGFGPALGSITAAKRRSIRRVAERWVQRYGRDGLMYRFDAIGITPSARTGEALIEHVEGAWGV